MLTAKAIRDKIFLQAEVFKNYYAAKEWRRARIAYDDARNMAVMMELDEEDLIELFGSRAYSDMQPPKKGLFHEDLVSKVYLECIRSNQTREYDTYPGAPRAKK